jgi:hypothetical protein
MERLPRNTALGSAEGEDRGASAGDRSPAAAPFVGRRDDRRMLDAALRAAIGGEGQAVLVAGEPGSGKSRLLAWLGDRASGLGARVLSAQCLGGPAEPPYWPWIEILRTYARQVPPDAVRSVFRGAAGRLAPLVPELAQLPSDPSDAWGDGEGLFWRLDAFGGSLRQVALADPLVILIEDLHLADTPSLLVFEWVAREIGDERLLLVATYRDCDVGPQHPLSDTLTELVRLPRFDRLVLSPLTREDVGDYLALLTGTSPAAAAVDAIYAYTAGNAMFVSEVARQSVRERLPLGAQDCASRAVPLAIRDFVRGRIGRLRTYCTRVLTAAAVIGRQFPLTLLCEVLAQPEDDVIESLEEGLALQLVARDASAPGHYHFAAPVLHAAILGMIPPSQRARLERRCARLVATPDDATSPAPCDPQAAVMRRDGEFWTIVFADTVMRLRDSTGLRCLSHLLRHPGRDLLALDVAVLASGNGTEAVAERAGGTVIDARARDTYKQRIRELEAEAGEAERCNDFDRVRRVRTELDFLLRELAHGLGLGNRMRTHVGPAERARINVTRTIKTAIKKITAADPRLGRHLTATVHTGVYCSYNPDPRLPIAWTS